MSRANHVVAQGDSWVVIRDGNSRPSSRHETKQEAITEAKRIAKKEKSHVFIHGRDGRIHDLVNFGEDRTSGIRLKTTIGKDRIREAVWNATKGSATNTR